MLCDIRQAVTRGLSSLPLVMIGLLGSAPAAVIETSATFGGTSQSTTQIDLNDDGLQAGISSAEVQGAMLGRHTCTAVTEEVATDPTDACPGGVFIIDAENNMGYSTRICTFPNGDQIFSRILTRTDCTDLEGGFAGEDTGEITGGTGQFVGATGTFAQTFSGFFQVFDEISNQGLASFTGETSGVLDAPNFSTGDDELDGGTDAQDCNTDGVVNGLDIIGAGCP